MKVALVMVTYNRYRVVLESLQAVFGQSILPEHIVVVDNSSQDGTAEKIRISGLPVDILRLDQNLGYAAGLKAGIEYVLRQWLEIDLVWLMDDDSIVSRDTLERLLAVKSAIRFSGLLSLSGFIDSIWSGPIAVKKMRNQLNALSPDFPVYSVDHALIDGALVDVNVIRAVGGPDPEFFMMCEDLEYCRRMKKYGYEILVYDNERLIQRLHFGGGGKFTSSSLWRGYYHARNHLFIVRKYFTLFYLFGYVIRQAKIILMAFTAQDRFQRIWLRFLGIYHGLIGVRGKTISPSE